MSSDSELRAARISRIQGRLLEASEQYPTLCHFAIDSKTAIDCAMMPRSPRDSVYSGSEHYLTLELDVDTAFCGSPVFLPRRFSLVGAPLFGRQVGVALNLLSFNSTSWFGCFHVGENEDANHAQSGITLLRKLTDPLAEEVGGPMILRRVHHHWLERVYEAFPNDRSSPLSGQEGVLAWLPHNVFFASARAIERPMMAGQKVTVSVEKGVICVGGTEHSAQAHHCQIIKALIDAAGLNVTGPQMNDLPGCHGKKISREISHLEKQIPALEKYLSHDGNKGYRIVQG